jgi:lipopolysaccharide export system protein LptA
VKRQLLCALFIASTLPSIAVVPGNALAQGLMQSNLGQNQDQPVQIEAASLEVHDKNKTATFSGNVQVVQGDTTMKCQSLIVFYGHEVGIAQNAATPNAKQLAVAPGPKGAQDIRRIEAHGGVTVVTKDQKASGDLGIYDLQSKTITLTGNVVVSQGESVIHGERVVVDTVSGNARVLSNEGGGAAPGRVRALILPNKGQNGGPGNMMTIGPGRTN